MPVGHLYVLLRKMSIQVVCSSFNQVVSLILNCMNCLHILDITPVPVISFANILSHSFLRLPSCFCQWFPLLCKSFLSLIGSQLFMFASVSFALGDRSKKKKNAHFILKSVVPMFSSTFMVSGLRFFNRF